MDRILTPVHDGWKPIFKPALNHLVKALETIDKVDPDTLAPPLNMVFSAFCIHPDDVKVIIIGQDPYPGTYTISGSSNKHGNSNKPIVLPEACGLSFSTDSSKTPASLKNIYACLNRLGYPTPSNNNNLRPWVYQGVLMLNMALTTIIGTMKAHTDIWKPFTNALIRSLTSYRSDKTDPLTFLLWGGDAKSIASSIVGKHHIIHTWTHPSPMSDNNLPLERKFINCTNFDTINDRSSTPNKVAIDWTIGKPLRIYTDGSDSTYAIYIPHMIRFSGKTYNNKYELIDDVSSSLPLIRPIITTDIKPTIPRCEYLAMCYAFHIALQLRVYPVELITDHVNICTILESKSQASTYNNEDLVTIMKKLYKRLLVCSNNRVTMIHTRSHEKDKSSPHNKCNNVVDKLAEDAKTRGEIQRLTFSSVRIKLTN